ncbi:hypothetical protein Q9L58_008741 [Maublancomyces gigas]|uniref:Uncharacterized protein n=1 Tax=Discina gigas TaxID=1032678 RepID=A0ABR3G9D0_9PEZI
MAPPSTTSPLSPIVIPAVQIPPHFTTRGDGLLHDSHARETIPALRFLLLSTPRLLENKGKPKSWWRAQCLLYGLDAPEKRTVQELRDTLELALLKGELQVPAAMAQLEQKERGKFRKLNAQVRDATGVGAPAPAPAAAPEKKSKVGKVTVKKKDLPKDPLKTVKNAGKVTKSKPGKKAAPLKNDAVTINLTVNMASAAAAAADSAAPAPARRRAAAKKAQPEVAAEKPPPKVRAKKAAGTAQPKPRAEKKPKAGASDPNYFELNTMQAEPEQAISQQPRRGRGGAPKAQSKAAPVKKEPGAPKTKQTARYPTRGGTGAKVVRMKKEKESPVWGEREDEDGDATMVDGIPEFDDDPRYSDQYNSDEYQWGHNVAY